MRFFTRLLALLTVVSICAACSSTSSKSTAKSSESQSATEGKTRAGNPTALRTSVSALAAHLDAWIAACTGPESCLWGYSSPGKAPAPLMNFCASDTPSGFQPSNLTLAVGPSGGAGTDTIVCKWTTSAAPPPEAILLIQRLRQQASCSSIQLTNPVCAKTSNGFRFTGSNGGAAGSSAGQYSAGRATDTLLVEAQIFDPSLDEATGLSRSAAMDGRAETAFGL